MLLSATLLPEPARKVSPRWSPCYSRRGSSLSGAIWLLVFRDALEYSDLFTTRCLQLNINRLAAHAREKLFVLIHHSVPIVVAANAGLCAVPVSMHQRPITQDSLQFFG